MTGQFSRRNLAKLQRTIPLEMLKNHPPPDTSPPAPKEPSKPLSNKESLDFKKPSNEDVSHSPLLSLDSTNQTLSSCSWAEDACEKEANDKVQKMLSEVDEFLFDQSQSSTLSFCLSDECKQWAQQFPFFRVVGRAISSPLSPIPQPVLISSLVEKIELDDAYSPNNLLQVEGHSLLPHSKFTRNANSFNEYADSPSKPASFSLEPHDESNLRSICPAWLDDDKLSSIREEVITQLAQLIWPQVLSMLSHQDTSNKVASHRYTSGINKADSAKSRILWSSTGTTPNHSQHVDDLKGILTVSSKVLLSRRNVSAKKRMEPPSSASLAYGDSNEWASRGLEGNGDGEMVYLPHLVAPLSTQPPSSRAASSTSSSFLPPISTSQKVRRGSAQSRSSVDWCPSRTKKTSPSYNETFNFYPKLTPPLTKPIPPKKQPLFTKPDVHKPLSRSANSRQTTSPKR